MLRVILFIVILMSLVSLGLAMYGKGNMGEVTSRSSIVQSLTPERSSSAF